MANQIRLKRSAVQGKAPVVGDLELGELAVNTYDGKLYMKKNDGADAIVEITAPDGVQPGDNISTLTNDSGFITSTVTGDFTVDTDTLYVDSTNNRVGIVKAAPDVALDVTGEIRASTGILFGTDTAADNTLNDYEEGDWTPVFAGASTAGSYTYGSQVGRYTKIGNLVSCHASLTDITTVSAGTGSVRITGLPFTSITDTVYPHGVIRLGEFDVPTTSYDLNCTAISNSTELAVILCRDSDVNLAVTVANKTSNTADIYLSITYRVA